MTAAPLLQVLSAQYAQCTWQEMPRVLRAEPPFSRLQLTGFEANFEDEDLIVGGMERFGPFAAALLDVALQPTLLQVHVRMVHSAQPAVMDALVDAALARRLPELSLVDCTPPAVAPLTRLLAKGSLAVLEIFLLDVVDPRPPLVDAAGAALVADALRVNTTLTKLELLHAHLCVDWDVASAFLSALVGHPSLREFRVTHDCGTNAENCIAFGASLAALIAADAPALQIFDCSNCALEDAGLAPIVQALALNRHLHIMYMRVNGMSDAFVRKRLLRAVHANTALRKLACANAESFASAAAEAEAMVRCRWHLWQHS